MTIRIKEDINGDLHIIRSTSTYQVGRLVLDEDDARWLAQSLVERFEQQDRDAIAKHLTQGIDN